MTITRSLYSLLVVALLVAGCNDDPIFPRDTSTGPGPGAATSFANITINSKIPQQIVEPDQTEMQELDVRPGLFMGNSNATLVYTGYGDSDLVDRLFRVDLMDNTELDTVSVGTSRTWPVMSGDESTLIYEKEGALYAMDPATGVNQQIGASLTFSVEDIATTNDGGVVAFISNSNLAGTNPGEFGQIFTLTTDGTDVVTQVTAFTDEYFETIQKQLAISGDGSKIFFHSDEIVEGVGTGGGSRYIYSINTNGTALAQISNLPLTGITRVSLQSDTTGANLAFTMEGNLYMYSAATSVVTIINTLVETDNPTDAVPLMYSLSADGSTLFYVIVRDDSETGDGYELFLLSNDPTGTDEEALYETGTRTETDSVGASANPKVASLHAAGNGLAVTFMSKLDFGATVEGDNVVQVYTYTDSGL